MQAMAYQAAVREAVKRVREAASDDERTEALKALEAIEQENIDNAPDTVEALTEAAPQLVAKIRESVKNEDSGVDELRARLNEAEGALANIADVSNISKVLRECDVTDDSERRHFVSQCRILGLHEADDIREYITGEREYNKRQQESNMAALRESLKLDEVEVEGVYGRVPTPQPDTVLTHLRESGLPLKEAS